MSRNKFSVSKRDRERRKAEKSETKRLRREQRKQSAEKGENPAPDVVAPEASDGSQTPPSAA